MHVLITNTMLANHSGSELYVRDLALELKRRGHQVAIYSPTLGRLAETMRLNGVEVYDNLDTISSAPDLIHAQHHIESMAALARFPKVPAVFVCHGWVPWEETPPAHPRILRYIGVSQRIQELLILQHGVQSSRVHFIPNFVDLQRFLPRHTLPPYPRKALSLSNQISDSNAAGLLRKACAKQGIRLDVAGIANGNPNSMPELLLPRYDLVFARGRAALEALACGTAVICCDLEGVGPMVSTANYANLRLANLGIQVLETPWSERAVREAICRYDPHDASEVTRFSRVDLDMKQSIDRVLDVYQLVLEEWRQAPRVEEEQELQAASRYLSFLSRTMRTRPSQLPSRQVHTWEMRKGLFLQMRWLQVRLNAFLVATHRLRQHFTQRARGIIAVAEPAQAAPHTVASHANHPELACIVLSLTNQPTLARSVRSLLEQDVPIEIVVVNSGGGDPAATLSEAGINVKVISQATRLFPGGARNVGILATKAPYIGFLAADCLAEPGWASERIRRHRGGASAVASAVTNALPRNLWSSLSHALLFPNRMPSVSPHRAQLYGLSYSREVFNRYGLFREDLRTGEDTEFNARFTPNIPIAWVPEVHTAHFHPTTLAGLLHDQYVRGARMVRARKQLSGGSQRNKIAWNALVRVPRSLMTAWNASTSMDRMFLVAAALGIPASAMAYALGALTSKNYRERKKSPVDTPRILALLVFHNEIHNLPDYFWNVSPQVDGILALDDGSTDGSGEFAARQPSVLELIRIPPRTPHDWDEPKNRRRLVQAAWKHQADWLMVVDADERVEISFRQRAIQAIARGEEEGIWAYRVSCRELWDDPGNYRSDGIWGNKRPVRLFKMRRDHLFDDRGWHGYWSPLNSQRSGDYVSADIVLYHLAMLTQTQREARQKKYQRIDPENQYQAIGYDYMTDHSGLVLSEIEHERRYEPAIPEGGGVRQVKLLALLTFHNEMAYLEDYFRNVADQVDGVIALDDGSTDGSYEFVSQQPLVAELIRLPTRSPHVWDQPRNHQLVIQAGLKHNADWFMALDADERLERNFRPRALKEIARAEIEGIKAFGIKFRELWDAPDRFRSDGLWGRKSQARFFKARSDHEFDERPHHCHWAPLNSRHNGGFPIADLIIYHLRMIHREDRFARQSRCIRLDPENRYQSIGYEYLTEEDGLCLEPLPEGRDYQPLAMSENRDSAGGVSTKLDARQ